MSPTANDRNDHDVPAALTVFFDGACPLCRREIDFYRRQRGGERIDWVDLSTAPADRPLAPGLDLETALARLHVMHPDGTFSNGAAAFAAIWRALPRFELIGRIARLAPMQFALEIAYRLFLRIRPFWRNREVERCDSRCDRQISRSS